MKQIALDAVEKAGVKYHLIAIYLMAIVASGIMTYIDANIDFALMGAASAGSVDAFSHLIMTGTGVAVMALVESFFVEVLQSLVAVNIRRQIIRDILGRVFVTSNIRNLLFNGKDDPSANTTAAESAADSICKCIALSVRCFTVLLTIGATTITAIGQIGWIALPFMGVLILLCSIGLYFQLDNKKDQEQVRKSCNSNTTQQVAISSRMVSSMINDDHKGDCRKFDELANAENIASTRLDLRINLKFYMLDAITVLFVMCYMLMVINVSHADLTKMYVVNSKITMLSFRIWSLFFVISEAIGSISKFAPAKEMLERADLAKENFKPKPYVPLDGETFFGTLLRTAATLETNTQLPKIPEGSFVQLVAPSGAGKSTFMKLCLATVVEWIHVGLLGGVKIIYIPQKPVIVTKDGCLDLHDFFGSHDDFDDASKRFKFKDVFEAPNGGCFKKLFDRVFCCRSPSGYSTVAMEEGDAEIGDCSTLSPDDEKIVVTLAQRLGRNHGSQGTALVTVDSKLERKLTSPSDGTIKLLFFIKMALPIYRLIGEGQSVAHFHLFLDEALAGLDPDARLRLIAIVKEMMGHGVSFLAIDHHKFETNSKPFKKVIDGVEYELTCPLHEVELDGETYPILTKDCIIRLGIKKVDVPSTYEDPKPKSKGIFSWLFERIFCCCRNQRSPPGYEPVATTAEADVPKGDEITHPPKVCGIPYVDGSEDDSKCSLVSKDSDGSDGSCSSDSEKSEDGA